MPNCQYWEDKLTEEIQLIEQMLTNRGDGSNSTVTEDQQIDKVLRDAFRTRRCFQTQMKMQSHEDQMHFLPRYKMLDRKVTELEFAWVEVDRSNSVPVPPPQKPSSRSSSDRTIDSFVDPAAEGKSCIVVRANGVNPIKLNSLDPNRMGTETDAVRTKTSGSILKRFRRGLFLRR